MLKNIVKPKSNLVVVDTSVIEIGCSSDGSKINRDEKYKFAKKKNWKIAKSKNLIIVNHDYFSQSKNIKIFNKLNLLIAETRLTFIKLRQIFIETSILCYLDSKYPIQIESNTSDYAIDSVFGQLALNDLS